MSCWLLSLQWLDGAVAINCCHTLTQERAALSPQMILFSFVYLFLLQRLVESGIQQTSEWKVIKKVVPKIILYKYFCFSGKELRIENKICGIFRSSLSFIVLQPFFFQSYYFLQIDCNLSLLHGTLRVPDKSVRDCGVLFHQAGSDHKPTGWIFSIDIDTRVCGWKREKGWENAVFLHLENSTGFCVCMTVVMVGGEGRTCEPWGSCSALWLLGGVGGTLLWSLWGSPWTCARGRKAEETLWKGSLDQV